MRRDLSSQQIVSFIRHTVYKYPSLRKLSFHIVYTCLIFEESMEGGGGFFGFFILSLPEKSLQPIARQVTGLETCRTEANGKVALKDVFDTNEHFWNTKMSVICPKFAKCNPARKTNLMWPLHNVPVVKVACGCRCNELFEGSLIEILPFNEQIHA